jgi:hypothetical protein
MSQKKTILQLRFELCLKRNTKTNNYAACDWVVTYVNTEVSIGTTTYGRIETFVPGEGD